MKYAQTQNKLKKIRNSNQNTKLCVRSKPIRSTIPESGFAKEIVMQVIRSPLAPSKPEFPAVEGLSVQCKIVL